MAVPYRVELTDGGLEVIHADEVRTDGRAVELLRVMTVAGRTRPVVVRRLLSQRVRTVTPLERKPDTAQEAG